MRTQKRHGQMHCFCKIYPCLFSCNLLSWGHFRIHRCMNSSVRNTACSPATGAGSTWCMSPFIRRIWHHRNCRKLFIRILNLFMISSLSGISAVSSVRNMPCGGSGSPSWHALVSLEHTLPLGSRKNQRTMSCCIMHIIQRKSYGIPIRNQWHNHFCQ